MNAPDLFEGKSREDLPLAARIRPKLLSEVVGQDHLLGAEGALKKQIEEDNVPSCVLWGPPGCGKTTIAYIISRYSSKNWEAFSAVSSGIKDVKLVIEKAKYLNRQGKGTILFVDEIHHFNKTQQDAFLPHIENGTITFIGATTENPSFYLNRALISRVQIYVLEQLNPSEIMQIIDRALNILKQEYTFKDEVKKYIADLSSGDARIALRQIETVLSLFGNKNIEISHVQQAMSRKTAVYDKDREEHYNQISALHKSLRDSDVQASLYWCARMIISGESPLYVLRRLIRFAIEDIGLADPNALQIAVNSLETYRFLGSPEGDIALAMTVIYLGSAPKSNRTYEAWSKATAHAQETSELPVPKVIRNAPTGLMKNLGYGEGYQYAPHTDEGIVNQQHFPENMEPGIYYVPADSGVEKKIKERMDYWKAILLKKE